MKKLNNKGFTLVELISVLVILIAIMAVAVPSISKSLGRSKEKQLERNKKVLENASELYVTNNKNKIFNSSGEDNCYIELEVLVSNNYVDKSIVKDSSGNDLGGVIIFDKSNYSFSYSNTKSVSKKCL